MQIVIIGNSAAGISALEAFRKYDQKSKITLISKETDLVYSRVLLPYYLSGKLSQDKIFIRDADYYKTMNVTLIKNGVTRINEKDKQIHLENKQNIPFDRLLIATGSSAIKPPITGLNQSPIFHMWTLDDVHQIDPLFKSGKRVLFLGSGFVSLKAASAAVSKGLDVSVYELMPRIMPLMVDDLGAELIQQKMLDSGAKLHVNTVTQKVEKQADGTLVVYAEGKQPLTVDFIIVGTGVRPNMEFLIDSSIKTDRGILVNQNMETSVPDIYAAGDVAQGPTTFEEQHQIHALWPTAVEMGKIAGSNMSGKPVEYCGSLSMNVTELFGITAASIGRFIEDGQNKGFVYEAQAENGYLKVVFEQGVPVGGTAVGNPELIPFLGMLRPMIRKRKKIECPEKKLFQYIHEKMASGSPEFAR
jgi:nitrite reductase (NADH) large subunit